LESQPFSRTGGKPAVRNDREDRGNVGIIRSPVRASILPDRTFAFATIPIQAALDHSWINGEKFLSAAVHYKMPVIQ
jgi:hypothetical protein